MTYRTENIPVETTKVMCLGDKIGKHPRVFLVLNAQNFVDCPYCGRRYVLNERLPEEA